MTERPALSQVRAFRIPGSPLRARGKCATHYNQTLTSRRKKITVHCDACGKTIEKEARTRRWATTHCDDPVCRHWVKYGAWSTRIPADHPSREQRPRARQPQPLTFREFACEWCGTQTSTMYATTQFCGVECKMRAKRARRRGRQFNAPGTFTWAEVVRLWMAFDKCCAYCRTRTPLPEIQAEHVTPLSRRGRNDLSNLLPSCQMCNSDKRDLLLHEWSADRLRRNLPAVTTTWAADDARYCHLAAFTALSSAS